MSRCADGYRMRSIGSSSRANWQRQFASRHSDQSRASTRNSRAEVLLFYSLNLAPQVGYEHSDQKILVSKNKDFYSSRWAWYIITLWRISSHCRCIYFYRLDGKLFLGSFGVLHLLDNPRLFYFPFNFLSISFAAGSR